MSASPQPGITTDEIDRAVHEKIIQAGAYPSPLGYYGFPKSICTSVNEVVYVIPLRVLLLIFCLCRSSLSVHGIPDSRKLQEGDIVKVRLCVCGFGAARYRPASDRRVCVLQWRARRLLRLVHSRARR